jgi:hypothetical protein
MGISHDVPLHNPSGDPIGSLQSVRETKIPESNSNKTQALLHQLGITQHLYDDLIKPRLEERALNKTAFNTAFAQFIQLLTATNSVENFTDILKSVAAKGIAETNLRKNKTSAIYHDAPHAAEVANNVDDLLKKYYDQDTQSDKTTADIISALAIAAAACHDIIQEQSSNEHLIVNETKSAALFADYVKKSIEATLEPHLIKSANPDNMARLTKIISDFKNILPFMSAELIVPTTYLVRPSNKPLAYYISQFETLEPTPTQKSGMNYLDEGALAISFCDTNRNLLMNTINNRVEMTELHHICEHRPQSMQSMNHMFTSINANTEQEKESFLLALGASIRMFPELNNLRSGEDKLDKTELAQLIQKLDAARTADPNELKQTGYAKYFNMFLNRLDMSLKFAESIDYRVFDEMAQRNHAGKLLQAIDKNGWQDHAKQLPSLKTHWDTLNKEQKENLAATLFNLAARQEGARLVLANTEVQKLLARPATFANTAPTVNRNRFFTPQKTQSAETSPTAIPSKKTP